MAKVLMILGMHRSGTSMLAQWLSACGLNIGKELQGVTFSNKFGHFEDSDFYKFHNILLKKNKCTYITSVDQKISVSDEMVKMAEKILYDRKDLPQWGWKEPRTCLFMNLWDDLIPDAYSIIIYRHYNEVVDSLYRRESYLRKPVNTFMIPARFFELISYRVRKKYHCNKFLEAWIRYNNDLIKYLERGDGNKKYLIFSVDDLINSSDIIFNTLTGKWGFKLNKTSIDDVFSESSMKRNSGELYKYDNLLVKAADGILAKFETLKAGAASE